MANFLRMILGVALLPSCWGVTRVLVDAIVVSTAAEGISWPSLSLLGGVFSFLLCWLFLPHPVRTYVAGHELTHALWGICFGASPSALKVGRSGGSVNLTKTNFLITLAPYFFPFYTFVVLLAAAVVDLSVGRLPWLPLWMFLVGFTWSFHFLFTLATLAQRQPDVTTYGRLFSWTFIYLVNVLLIVLWLACVTDFTFARFGHALVTRVPETYVGLFHLAHPPSG